MLLKSWDCWIHSILIPKDRMARLGTPKELQRFLLVPAVRSGQSIATDFEAYVPDRGATAILLLLVTLFFLLTLPLLGQADRARVSGIVTDETQAVIPGVKVTALNIKTGVTTTVSTNEMGNYSLVNIPIGPYEIRFSLPGFKTFERTGYNLTAGQMSRLDVALEVGEPHETVVVTANAELLNQENTRISKTMQSDVTTDLPLTFVGGRSIEAFAYTTVAGVEGNNWESYIAGGPAFTKEVLIDGISATAQIQGHIGESSPSLEAVAEFNVQTSGTSVETGHTSGGVFNFALKSGTNRFSGSAFFYARNEALNANTWMNNWLLTQYPGNPRFERALDRRYVLGGSAGGPILIPGIYDGRDRTFIFGALEYYDEERLLMGDLNNTVPIPEFLEGDFGRLLTEEIVGTDVLGRPVYDGQINDPATFRQVDGQWVSDPFPGNVLPKDRFSIVSSKIVELYKSGYLPMVGDRLVDNSAVPFYNPPWFHQTQFTLKLDHELTESNRISGSYIWTKRPRLIANGLWDPLDPEKEGGPLSKSRIQKVTSHRVALKDNWTIRPNLLNTLALAFNRYRNPSEATTADGDWANKLGLGDSTNAGSFPRIHFQGNSWAEPSSIGQESTAETVANTYILSDSLDWTLGNHILRLGGEFWRQQLNEHEGGDFLIFPFLSATTGLSGYPWSDRTGFAFASFLLGDLGTGSKHVPFDTYGRRDYFSLFVVDDFKISPRLTLNLGLRWEQPRPYREKHGRWSNFNLEIMNSDLGVMGAVEFAPGPEHSFEGDANWTQFSPRLGFAYRLTERAVIRAGYGISRMPPGIQYWSAVPYAWAPGFRAQNRHLPSFFEPLFNWDSGYPDNWVPPDQDPNMELSEAVNYNPATSLKPGYVHQYNLSFQYSLSDDAMIELAFLGNEGRRMHNSALRRNQPTREAYEDPSVNPFAWIWDEAGAAAAGVEYPYPGFSGFAGSALAPYPHLSAWFASIFFQGTNLGQGSYRSLQFSFSKRLSAGIAAEVSYNHSKAKGNTESGFGETWFDGGVQDCYDLEESASTVTSFDQTHVFKGYVRVDLPFGRGRRWLSNAHPVLDGFLGGWMVTTIFRYNSGSALQITPDVWYPGWSGFYSGSVYADVAPDADFSRQFTPETFNPGAPADFGNRYFDPDSFSNPTNHQLGNGKLRYAELRGFGYAGEDIGLMKSWQLQEDVRVQFRAEFLNVFNRSHFSDPVTAIGGGGRFGNVTEKTGIPRNIQLGLRLTW